MALSPDQEQLEHRLRVSQMLTSIEQMEENIAKFKHYIRLAEEKATRDIEKFRHDIAMDAKKNSLEVYKIIISLIVGAAACVGAGVALATYVEHHQTPAPVQQTEGRP